MPVLSPTEIPRAGDNGALKRFFEANSIACGDCYRISRCSMTVSCRSAGKYEIPPSGLAFIKSGEIIRL